MADSHQFWFTSVLGADGLRGVAGTAAGQLAGVDGYEASGDGGGGQFWWDATSIAADDGGAVIQVAGVATGRWRRVCSGEVNVQWFGAGISSKVSARAAIQNAPGATTAGILLNYGTHGIVQGNVCTDSGQPPVQTYGLWLSGASHVEVLGNILVDNLVAPLHQNATTAISLWDNHGASSALHGRATLSPTGAGYAEVTVTGADYQPGDDVFLAVVSAGGQPGVLWTVPASAGSFRIRSSSALDSSTVAWRIAH